LVFDIAVGMVRQSPYLSGRLKVVPSTKRIVDPQTGSYLRAIPADAAGSHGFNAHGVVRTSCTPGRTGSCTTCCKRAWAPAGSRCS